MLFVITFTAFVLIFLMVYLMTLYKDPGINKIEHINQPLVIKCIKDLNKHDKQE